MEAASRSVLQPLKDELEPLPDSDGPAPARALNAPPADASTSSTQELVSMESLMGWSELPSRGTAETPSASDFLIPAEALREEARKLEELLDSLSNLPIGNADTAVPIDDSSSSLTSKKPALDPTVPESPAPAALNRAEPQDLPLAPLPFELEKLPEEILPPASQSKATIPSKFAESITPAAPVAPTVAVPPASTATVRPAAISAPPIKRAPIQSTQPVITKPAAQRPDPKPVAAKPVTPSTPLRSASVAPQNSAPPPAKITAYPNAAPAAAPAVPNVMDRDFIARNQIVERYLSGKLPVKGASDFERFCHDHPDLLDEIGLPQRVHAGLRLLEASGKPEPWQQETKKRFWEKSSLVFGFMGAAAVLAVVAVMLTNQLSDKNATIAKLKRDLVSQPLEPAATTRIIRVLPSRTGSSNTPAVTIGGANAQLCDLRIDMSRSAFRSFRVTIDRIDQGRVAVLQNIYKDSNGHVRIALNSSALGPGNYSFSIDGITWRGETVPDAWVTIGIQR